MLKSIVDLLFPLGLMGCSEGVSEAPSYRNQSAKEREEVEEEVKENLKDDSDDEEKLINSEDINLST